ncbi:MAG: PQQ-binding-like beta-propeller repeat protein, partial [bacterium]
MASTNGVNFRPARKLAGDLLRALPERTLAIYRLQTEEATRRVAGGAPPPSDLAALAAQYRNALPGAPAAAAGLSLAGLYLDQERFREARSVLRDALDEAPADFAPRSELLARLVVACARIGDAGQAAWAWAELQKRQDADRWAALGAELRPEAAPASNAWTMAYGGPSRPGVATGTSPDLAAEAGATLRWGLNTGGGMIGAAIGILSRGNAVAQVTRKGRRPADDVIFAGNRAWVNGFGEFIVVDLATGRAIGRTAHVTDAIQGNTLFLSASLLFGNRLNRAASLIGEHVYCVEDNFRASLGRGQIAPAGQPAGNALAAYAADTGRLLWRLGRDVTPQAPEKVASRWRANAICFAGAPVACGGVLVAPIEDVYGFGAVGLDAETGAPLWRTRLAAYPQIARDTRLAPVTLTVDGANAYVCSGRGSVSLLDGCDGSVRWTTLYETFADIDSTNRFGADGMPDMWEESVVLVAGEAAVVLPEDAPDIMACDRRSGVRLWTRRKPAGVDYVVGRRGTTLIVAGVRAVVGVDLA